MAKLTSELYKGAYNGATAYTPGDTVTVSGSSYVCIANTTGNTPPNASYWVLLAQAGTNGTNGADGADGEVQGPASATDSAIVLFDGTTGEIIKDSFTTIVDEDTMSSDSATKVPTQQSVKAYVDANSGSSDGWIEVSDTWTYASATTFTIAGVDRTSVLTPGTKIKLTQTTVKYFVVASSAFSTDTTVTLMATTDYSLANAAITSPFYSYHDAQGFPSAFNYSTANITGFTANPTANVLKYMTRGRQIYILFEFFGTSNATTMTMTVPVIASPSATQYVQTCAVCDNGTWTNPGVVGFKSSESAATIYWGKSSTAFTSNSYGGFTSSGTKQAMGVFTYTF